MRPIIKKFTPGGLFLATLAVVLLGELVVAGGVEFFEETIRRLIGLSGEWERLIEDSLFVIICTPLLYLLLKQELKRRQKTEERIQYQAYYDFLTDLPNRALFNQRIAEALVEAEHQQQMFAVAFLDLNRFKYINDTLNHSVGDLLLQTVADRLKACLPTHGMVARWGGDEFTILLTDIQNEKDVLTTVEKFTSALAEPYHIEGHELYLSSSIGISLFPRDGNNLETLVKHADRAMYHAKESQKGFLFYSQEMNATALKRLMLEHSMRKALQEEEFVLFYQPQVDVASGRIVAMEALLRWNHPELGLLSPMEFIPLAEETGFIIQISEWVLRTACKQNKAWQDIGFPSLRVAVNLSGRHFDQQNLADTVAQVLTETGLAPKWLELEMTESIFMKDTAATVSMLNELEKLGIQFSIDDFGTGYSSLNYLKRFPIHCLKIDRSFVRDITKNPDDATIATAMILMAQNLNIGVVAEGVETQEQLLFLQERGCRLMQGYFFHRPVPADEFEQLLYKEPSLEANHFGTVS